MRWHTLLLISTLSVTPSLASAENLDWLLDCNPKQAGFDYYAELDKLKNGSIPSSNVVAAIRRDLPHQFIGHNSECIYDAILFFGDESIVSDLKKRQKQPNQTDEPGYVEDLIRLLKTRSERYGDQAVFAKEMSSYRHPVSLQHFLELHLKDISTREQLNIMLSVIQEKKLPGAYHYIIQVFLRKIYAASPAEYDGFVSSLSKAPLEFTCFKDNSCP